MKKPKILNLYCGIGGNRKLWGRDYDVTAVDHNPAVLEVYEVYNPQDTIICGDAHQYLLDHYHEFDVIWSSPPCPTHSRMARATRHDVRKYPDMALYQEILWLKHHFGGVWVVENVIPYYEPLIAPQQIGRHCFWSNKIIRASEVHQPDNFIQGDSPEHIRIMQEWLDIRWKKPIYLNGNHSPGQVYRNCVHPRLGLEVLQSLLKKEGLFEDDENGYYSRVADD